MKMKTLAWQRAFSLSGHERTFEPAVETSGKQPFVRLDARGAVYSPTFKGNEARAHWNPL